MKWLYRVTYLPFSMLPRPVDEIHREDLHAKASLNPIDHNLQALTVPDHKSWVVQLIRHLFEVQIRILNRKKYGIHSRDHSKLYK